MKNKIAIVTGVSRLKGIGRAICLELAKKGTDIYFTYWLGYDNQMPWGVNESEPVTIQKELIALGVNCEKIELDLSKVESIAVLFNDVESKLGNPSILVNNATYSTYTDIQTITSEEIDRHYEINIRATTLLAIEFIRRFQGESGGRIINLSSGQSLSRMSNEIAYAITKGAIETLTYTLQHETAEKGITINAVNPGPTDSGWMNDTMKAELLKRFPMKRIGLPNDAARLISFLASEESEWITGQIIHSDGGFKN
ncbi:MAG: SDR family oxidoreductase [Bacteroidota bacterium]